MGLLLLNVYQANRTLRPSLIGTATVMLQELPRSELVQDWWCIKPVELTTSSSDTLGELSLDVKVEEEIIMPLPVYQGIAQVSKRSPETKGAVLISSTNFPSIVEAAERRHRRRDSFGPRTRMP